MGYINNTIIPKNNKLIPNLPTINFILTTLKLKSQYNVLYKIHIYKTIVHIIHFCSYITKPKTKSIKKNKINNYNVF